ncbi:MAG: M18 family aminopeptidase [Fusobacterium sp.]|uniref:M18 family aminopeptidase n=1 Tax=Fusobacterium sp. TaxID=68766 RepID=UPI0026DD0584|nr:M18 family aminopeptidase [Fusobacterium sp.]MDO4690308.1 M18 family aminopeptidase [Fusobacterium sp.]
MNKQNLAKHLMKFIDASPSNYFACINSKDLLLENGFTELFEDEKWKLKKGGKYFVVVNDSSFYAFTIGSKKLDETGFKIAGSHTDSPSFLIKPNPEINKKDFVILNTEVYGGPIFYTWFDRPLSISGRVFIESKDPFKPIKKFLNYDKDLLIIPSLCIHQNREVNNGVAFNAQKETLPLISIDNKKNFSLKKIIADYLNVKENTILSYDLTLYSREKACFLGINNEFISAGRLDNLAAVHAGLMALIDNKVKTNTCVVAAFDNEEIGSNTMQGADSPVLRTILERIAFSLELDDEEYERALSKSFLISTDAAHSIHPNYLEKSDPTNEPKLNAGPVIKMAANKAYITDGYSRAVIEKLAKDAKIPVQTFVNRSDLKGGSTIGPITQSQIKIPGIDMGNPLLSMHSVRELGGVDDHYNMYSLIGEFFKK